MLIKKILMVFIRSIIKLFDGINNKFYTDIYYKYLKNIGIKFLGRPNYIHSSVYFDGKGYDLITIGEDVVLSREVMLLTHDYSIETALHTIDKGTLDRHLHINQEIYIGNNTFIGARVSLLPGTRIGNNCIVGACTVVKGNIPDNCVVIGNPMRVIKKTEDLGNKIYQSL